MQKLLYGIGLFLALLIVIGLALPRHSRVEVSTQVDANPATVFALVNDFHRVSLWSPKTETDPNARIVYAGPDRGVGARVTWDGTVVGSGTQTIVESRPYEYVATLINAGEPGEARTWFELSDDELNDGSGTLVRWGFEHDYGFNLVGRYFGPILNGVIRREHEAGLVSLTELAESLPRADFSDLEIEHLVVEAIDIAYLPTRSAPEPTAISEAMGASYFEILSFIDDQGLVAAGAPMSIMRNFSGAEMQFDAAIPIQGATDSLPDGSVETGVTYAGPVIRAKHIGSYRNLNQTHRKIVSYLSATGIERLGDAWESYVSDPAKVAEQDLLTMVYYPILISR